MAPFPTCPGLPFPGPVIEEAARPLTYTESPPHAGVLFLPLILLNVYNILGEDPGDFVFGGRSSFCVPLPSPFHVCRNLGHKLGMGSKCVSQASPSHQENPSVQVAPWGRQHGKCHTEQCGEGRALGKESKRHPRSSQGNASFPSFLPLMAGGSVLCWLSVRAAPAAAAAWKRVYRNPSRLLENLLFLKQGGISKLVQCSTARLCSCSGCWAQPPMWGRGCVNKGLAVPKATALVAPSSRSESGRKVVAELSQWAAFRELCPQATCPLSASLFLKAKIK